MKNKNNIIGCFVSINMEDNKGDLFRKYIFRKKGICERLKRLNYEKYGRDIKLILFQFYVNPIPYELQNLKEIENYRSKEKSIGIPIIINTKDFFNVPESTREDFIILSIINKINLLDSIVKQKKLDSDIESLIEDIKGLFKK